MDKEMFRYFNVIGSIQSSVAKASSIDEALHNGIEIIMKECGVDYVAVWFEDVKGDSILHPYYWISPVDLSFKSQKNNEGSVGRVYQNQTTEKYLDYSVGQDVETDRNFEGVAIGSLVTVPLSNKYDKLGCVQFINAKTSKKFTDDDADVFEMLSTLIAIAIDENVKLSKPQEDKKVIISVKNIEKSFKNGEIVTKVLKGVNMNVYEGEFLVLLGESGCGKSTLLNIIGGLDKADAGEFIFMGKDMFNASEDELTEYRRDNIGFIFQSYNLMPNLNSEQNLDLIGELIDNPLDSSEALRLVGMQEKGRNYPSQLSGGQQQRVSIARSLVKNPKIIMADEPTAALDYETSIVVLKALEEIAKAGTTLIMVTHNEEITKMADRVVRFRNGRMYEVVINKHPLHAEELVW